MTDEEQNLVRRVCDTATAWQQSDGIFPEPEYDDFLAALDELTIYMFSQYPASPAGKE